MCLTPIKIKNPNYGLHYNPSGKVKHIANKYKDTHSQYISVPCGHCPECVHYKQMGYIQRSYIESLDSYFFFCTLTYNNESLPCLTVGDYDLYYADKNDFQNFVKRLRNYRVFGERDFKYIAVSEFGTKRHRPHWHILFAVRKFDSDDEYTPLNLEFDYYGKILDAWSRNIGSKKNPVYVPLLTMPKRNTLRKPFDFHYCRFINGSNDDVPFYVTKYVLKFDRYVEKLHSALKLSYSPEDFKEIWSIVKPKFYMSKGFGNPRTPEGKDLIARCLDFSFDFPKFFNQSTGEGFPMSRYLKKRFMTMEQLDKFAEKYPRDASGNIIFSDNLQDIVMTRTKFNKFRFQKNLINSNLYDE